MTKHVHHPHPNKALGNPQLWRDMPMGDEHTGRGPILWVFLFVLLFFAFAAWGIWEAFA